MSCRTYKRQLAFMTIQHEQSLQTRLDLINKMSFSKLATLSTLLASASMVAGHGYVSSIVANGQKYILPIPSNHHHTNKRLQLHGLHREPIRLRVQPA
jgi:hypothetical protein